MASHSNYSAKECVSIQWDIHTSMSTALSSESMMLISTEYGHVHIYSTQNANWMLKLLDLFAQILYKMDL